MLVLQLQDLQQDRCRTCRSSADPASAESVGAEEREQERECTALHHNVDRKMLYENGRGIILPDLTESLKIGVTVPCLKVFAAPSSRRCGLTASGDHPPEYLPRKFILAASDATLRSSIGVRARRIFISPGGVYVPLSLTHSTWRRRSIDEAMRMCATVNVNLAININRGGDEENPAGERTAV